MLKINVPRYQIEENTPFSADFFKREQLIKSICKLAERLDEPIVVGLNAPWGHGKTTIIDRLEAHIKQETTENISLIRYDAFKNDYISDVFVSITSEINHFLEEVSGKSEPGKQLDKLNLTKKQLVKYGKGICKSLIKNSIVRGVKYASGGILDLPEMHKDIEKEIEGAVNDSAEDIADETISTIDALLDERFLTASQDQGLIAAFSKKLEEAISDTGKKRLIFVIDELDRCQPSFAVEVLEKIKHFFSVKNILFILVYNKKQLENSVAHIYGVDKPGVYLQRFIDFEANVSIESKKSTGDSGIGNYVSWLVKQHGFDQQWNDPISKTINESFLVFGEELSLRAIDRICTKIAAYCLIRESGYAYDKHLVTLLCVIFVCNQDHFASICERAQLVHRNTRNGDSVECQLEECQTDLKEFLQKIKSNESYLFRHFFEKIINHLYILDGENHGKQYESFHMFVDREEYIHNVCELLTLFQIE